MTAWKSHFTRWRILLIILVLAGLAAWWWLARQPKTYRLLRQFPLSLLAVPGHVGEIDGIAIREHIIYTQAGLVMRTAATSVTLFDWEGRKQWCIDVGCSNKSAWAKVVSSTHPIVGGDITWAQDTRADMCVSPNGRYLASVTTHGRALALTTWCDGKPIGTLHLPLTQAAFTADEKPFCMAVLDSGRVMLAVRDTARVISSMKVKMRIGYGSFRLRDRILYQYESNLLYIDGAQVIAHCSMNEAYGISPDGSVVAYFTGSRACKFARITITGANIKLDDSFGSNADVDVIGYGFPPSNISLLSNRLTYTGNEIYDGKTPKVQLTYPGRFFVPPDARHLLQYGPAGQLEVLDLSTLKSWGVTPMGAYGGGVLTMDGRHVLVIPGHRSNYRFSPIIERIIALKWADRAQLIDTATRALVLCEAPGTVVAYLPLRNAGYSKGQQYTGNSWGDYSLHGIYPSPDGRTLILIGKPQRSGFQCLVFRY